MQNNEFAHVDQEIWKNKIMNLKTPDSWAEIPLSDLPALLSDHAYLERKAASNALELLNRWPEPRRPKMWTTILAAVARDEALHLHQVIRLMSERRMKLDRLHRSGYASDLRKLVRMGQGPLEILDRLLVSGLIEARSCERFEILARQAEDRALGRFYKGLAVAEKGHHAVFLKLAKAVVPEAQAKKRWAELAGEEARIIRQQPVGPGLHSGWESAVPA
jgi:tRNA-(ms[2]io[6]A)-hydroxylase